MSLYWGPGTFSVTPHTRFSKHRCLHYTLESKPISKTGILFWGGHRLGFFTLLQKTFFTSPLSFTSSNLSAQSSAPLGLVPAAFASTYLISVKKQFNHRWAQSLHINTCNLWHSLSSVWVAFCCVRTCCASNPVTWTKSLPGIDPTLSLLLCFPAVATGLILLFEPMPRLCLNVVQACRRWADTH